MQRPTGITILAVLAAIGGVLGLLGALGLFALSGVGGFIVTLFALLTLALSILALAFAYGAWTLQPWAWVLGVANYGLSIILSIIQIIAGWSTIGSQLLSIVIAALILYYLNTPEIKRAFGRS